MTEYNAPSLDEGTGGALAPRNDSFPFRSDESIDGLFAYDGGEGSSASASKEDAAGRDAADRKDGSSTHEGAGASPEGDNGQSRNRGASHQSSEVSHKSGSGHNQSGAVAPGNDAAAKKPGDVNSSDVLFDDLGLPEDLLAAVKELGFSTPTAIQAAAIPILLRGKDVVGVAQTGTGKTAAFALPLLAHIDPDKREVQALVLAPTRELAMQGAQAIESFAAKSRGVDVAAVYGGSSYLPQLRALEGGAQVVVGTPGRIMDLMDRGALRLDSVRYFVLDEADEMLRMGFAEDVEKIASEVPEGRISALFSATMPPPIRRVAERHLSDAEEVTISRPATTVSTVKQMYAVVPERHKIGALARVLAVTEAQAALVFVRTRSTAEDLTIELGARGVATAALSGDVVQKEREKLVARLRDGTLDVLVATDVAARGLDVDRIGLVVNFDVPRETDTYVHRIGRTGRAGRTGESITFVTPKERPRLRRIEKQTGSRMEQIELPTPAEVSKLRARRTVEQAMARVAKGRLWVYEEILEDFVAEQAKAAAQSAPGADLDSHEHGAGSYSQHDSHPLSDPGSQLDSKDQAGPVSLETLTMALLALAVRDPGPVAGEEPERLTEDFGSEREGRPRKERQPRRQMKNSVRYRVEVGHKDRVKPGAIVGALTHEGGLSGSDLGHIDIFPTFSLVEIGVPLSPEARKRISQARVSGRALKISEDRGPGGFRDDAGRGRPRRDSDYSDRGRSRGDRGSRYDRTTRDERGFKHDRRGRAGRGHR